MRARGFSAQTTETPALPALPLVLCWQWSDLLVAAMMFDDVGPAKVRQSYDYVLLEVVENARVAFPADSTIDSARALLRNCYAKRLGASWPLSDQKQQDERRQMARSFALNAARAA